jgi:hypothetical protein
MSLIGRHGSEMLRKRRSVQFLNGFEQRTKGVMNLGPSGFSI